MVFMKGAYTTISLAALQAQIAALQALEVKQIRISIPSAQVLTLNSNPVQLLPSPGVGFTYQFLDIMVTMIYFGVPYTTNLLLNISFVGAGLTIGNNSAILASSISRSGRMAVTNLSAAGASQYLTNTAVEANVSVANPVAGTGTLEIDISYRSIAR